MAARSAGCGAAAVDTVICPLAVFRTIEYIYSKTGPEASGFVQSARKKRYCEPGLPGFCHKRQSSCQRAADNSILLPVKKYQVITLNCNTSIEIYQIICYYTDSNAYRGDKYEASAVFFVMRPICGVVFNLLCCLGSKSFVGGRSADAGRKNKDLLGI